MSKNNEITKVKKASQKDKKSDLEAPVEKKTKLSEKKPTNQKAVSKSTPDSILTGRSVAKKEQKVPSFAIHKIGRRKTAIARLFAWKNESGLLDTKKVNNLPYESYFSNSLKLKHSFSEVFSVVGESFSEYSFFATINGGGKSAQSQALAHAFARFFASLSESNKSSLRGNGMLTRDSRMVESKNTGLRGSRKREQYAKR